MKVIVLLFATWAFSTAVLAHANGFSKALSWDPSITFTAKNVIEANGQIVFQSLRVQTLTERNVYLAYAPENSGHNPDEFMLLKLCRDLTGGAYSTFAGTFGQGEETLVMSRELPSYQYIFGPRIFYFDKTGSTCAPWNSELANYEWGTSRYVENLICEIPDQLDQPTRLYRERCGE